MYCSPAGTCRRFTLEPTHGTVPSSIASKPSGSVSAHPSHRARELLGSDQRHTAAQQVRRGVSSPGRLSRVADDDDLFPSAAPPRPRRADATENARRILRAATQLLRADPDTSVEEIAAAAGVSRATVYRHFEARERLLATVRQEAVRQADANGQDMLRPPGELAAGATPLSIPDVLNKVPPHLLGEQIVAEAQRLAGVSSVALYVLDIDGTQLLRLAGSDEFPERLDAPLAVGPELPREGLPALGAVVDDELPGSVIAPLLLRGRALGVLLAVNAPAAPLLELARHAAGALALAGDYTDFFDARRRRRETTPAAEIQQNLLPPRIARIAGGILAGNVLPGYDGGGDWFDYVENPDGAWLGVADSHGSGTTAGAIGSVALGAFRSKRRAGAPLEEVAAGIHATMRALEIAEAFVSVVLGRWHGPSATFRWITCGSQPPLLITAEGELRQLEGSMHPPLGLGDGERSFRVEERGLEPGDRLLLLSDGVLDRRTQRGEPFGLRGVRAAVARAAPGAAPTVRAIEDAITTASADPLEDDATIVVFAPSAPLD
jgi:serine phosphatase RsbU (regulator of sigma subunit)